MELLMNVTFHWSGKDTELSSFKIFENVLSNAFMKSYDKAVDALNPNYERWNREFDELYPNDDEDRSDPNSKYMNYIRGKQNTVLYGVSLDDPLFMLYSGEQGEIRGSLKIGHADVFTTFEPVHETKKVNYE